MNPQTVVLVVLLTFKTMFASVLFFVLHAVISRLMTRVVKFKGGHYGLRRPTILGYRYYGSGHWYKPNELEGLSAHRYTSINMVNQIHRKFTISGKLEEIREYFLGKEGDIGVICDIKEEMLVDKLERNK